MILNIKIEVAMDLDLGYVFDVESEYLLSQRSLLDILDVVQSDSDIDKVFLDGESDSNDKDWLGFGLELGEDVDSKLLQDGRKMKVGFFLEEDEMEEFKKLGVDDIFNDDDFILCFFFQEELVGVDLSCELKSKKRIILIVKNFLFLRLKRLLDKYFKYD